MRPSLSRTAISGLPLLLAALAPGCGSADQPPARALVPSAEHRHKQDPPIPAVARLPALETPPALNDQAVEIVRATADQATDALDRASDTVAQSAADLDRTVDEVSREFDRGIRRVNASLDRLEGQLDRALAPPGPGSMPPTQPARKPHKLPKILKPLGDSPPR